MLQHPIPQNITSYQFRLIGDMTIKQFVLLLIGGGIAFLAYTTNLFPVIKWAIILTSVVGGFIAAFMPIEERSLDQWLIAFFKAIYLPTQFVWKKTSSIPGYFTYTPQANLERPDDAAALAAAVVTKRREGLTSYLQTLPHQASISKLENTENQSLDQITGLFSQNLPPIHQAPVIHPDIPTPNPLSPSIALAKEGLSIPASPAVAIGRGDRAPTTLYQSPSFTPRSPALRDVVGQPQSTQSVVPRNAPANLTSPKPLIGVGPTLSPALAPNLPSGVILDSQLNALDGAIVEIRDHQHIPVRATKTNRLGQFLSSTPLKNGQYEVIVEKDGHTFPATPLEVVGAPLPPLKIQALA